MLSSFIIPNTGPGNSALNLTIRATVHSAKAGRPLIKQAIPHPASCQPPTNSLQSSSLGSLECVCAEPSPCHISPSRGRDRPGSSDSSSQHTALSRAAFSPRRGELHHVRGIKGCQSVWLCTAVRVIHSSFAQTGLCVHFTGAGLLNQHRGRTHAGTGGPRSAGCLPQALPHLQTHT